MIGLPILSLELVVLTVKVVVTLVDVEVRDTEDGLSEQLMPAAELGTVHDKLTVPLNPLAAETVIVELPDCPAETLVLEGSDETE